jgi:hypothetical protein
MLGFSIRFFLLLFTFNFIRLTSMGQKYYFQNGLSLSGGTSSTAHYDANYKKLGQKEIKEKTGFAWDISYLNTRNITEHAAFTYGISVTSLNNSFESSAFNYIRKDGSSDEIQFVNSNQKIVKYLVGISFRMSFFLNNGMGRFFIGPGFAISAPVYTVANITGQTIKSDSINFEEKYFPEKEPYVFIPCELSFGYQQQFNNSSLLRIETFGTFKADGIFKKAIPMHLEKFLGLRMSYFFKKK